MKDINIKAINKKMDALKGEAEFWKKQFMSLVDIITRANDVADETFEHIQKILND